MNFKIASGPDAHARIDKWLVAARFYKTRSLAAVAIAKGRVRIGQAAVKAAREVRVGDRVEIDIDRITREVEVKGVCEARGPASVAQALYAETEPSRARRQAELERRRVFREPAAALPGRPTKHDRRSIARWSDAPED